MLEGESPDDTSREKNLTVVYAARTPQQGHLLKNLLAERGIRAIVTNDVLSGGAGVDVVGWATQPRVAVAEEDADEARRIAVEFDRTVSADPDLTADAEAGVDAEGDDDDWPLCPQCGTRRPTRCPICETTGTVFPRSDPDYLAASQLAEAAERHACGCGSGGCSSHGGHGEEAAEPSDEEAGEEAAAASEPEPPDVMRTCTTCDEPFVPQHPRRCAWCGHEFDDGYACAEEESQLMEPLTGRAIAVILILVGLAAALLAYFQFIL
jgi:hypothetical protein